MIVRFEWIFCCKNSVFSCLKNEKKHSSYKDAIRISLRVFWNISIWTCKMDTQKMDQHVLSKWPLRKSSQKGGDVITLRREEYHKLGYVVTCRE